MDPSKLLEALREETLPRLQPAQAALQKARKEGSAQALKPVRELMHKVAGTAALAGLPHLTRLCRLGEGLAVLALDGEAKASAKLFDLLDGVLGALEDDLKPGAPAASSSKPVAAVEPVAASAEGRVVVASDEAVSGKLLVRLLEEAGFGARRITLDEAADALPDCELLLLDVPAVVPRPKLEDALENGKKLRLPVIITTKSDVGALASRAAAVLQKPVSPDALEAAVRTQVQRRLAVAAARAKAPTGQAPKPAPKTATPLKVLVVDDSRVIRGVVREALAEVGAEVLEAGDGAEALLAFEASQPDAVISDLQMPGVDGSQLIPLLRERMAGRRVPIIVLSALEDEASRRAALAAGADAYLVKSIIDGPQLLRTLKAAGLPLP